MPACPFDAVIFDLDGVLLDSEPIYLAATNEVLAREGRYLSPAENARYSGARYRDVPADIIPRLGLAHDIEHYLRETRRRSFARSAARSSRPRAPVR